GRLRGQAFCGGVGGARGGGGGGGGPGGRGGGRGGGGGGGGAAAARRQGRGDRDVGWPRREPHGRARVRDHRHVASVRAGSRMRRRGCGKGCVSPPRGDRAHAPGLSRGGLEHQRYVRERRT